MLVYKSPRLLTSAHLSKIVPPRLAAMERLLPGVDVQRCGRGVRVKRTVPAHCALWEFLVRPNKQ